MAQRNKDDRKMFPCHLCTKEYSWQSSLDKHLKIHTEVPHYNCKSCSKTFRHKSSLDQHLLSKHDPDFKKYMCDLCGAKYVTKWGLARHGRLHSDNNNNNTHLFCGVCGKMYIRKDLLDAHERTHLPKSKCDNCQKEVFHLEKHAKICSSLKKKKQFECHLCKKKFKELRYLHEHNKCKHVHLERYECESCGSRYSYRASLSNHKKICKK